jgi:hypothetical protein
MCLNDTNSRVRVGKHMSDMFRISNGSKQLSPLLFKFALKYATRMVQALEIKLHNSVFLFMLMIR